MFKNKTLVSLVFVAIMGLGIFSIDALQIYANEENKDEKYDYDTSGYEAWLPDAKPSKAREMYVGYNRNGNFLIYNTSTGSLVAANRMQIVGAWNNPIKRFYLVNGGYIDDSASIQYREYVDTTGSFQLLRDCKVYTFPFNNHKSSEVLPKGKYVVTKESLDFIELIMPDGRRCWVNPQYTDNTYQFIAANQGYFEAFKSSLDVTQVNGVPIKQMMMPIREDKRTGFAMQPKYVTIHNTANGGAGANAYSHANAQINDRRTYVSWHYTVDNNEIYQSIPMNEVAYHAGDGTMIGNSTSIGIEICENSDGNYAQAERNAAYLTARILYENGLPANAVRMHKDWSGKNCAHNIIEGTKGTMGWSAFLALVQQEYNRIVSENEEITGLDEVVPSGFEPYINTNNFVFKEGVVSNIALGTSPANLQDLLQKVDTNAKVSITQKATSKVATGDKVVITNSNGATFTFAIAIKGDVNGDGEVFATDYVRIKNYIMGSNYLDKASKIAADINGDGKVYATDYVRIKNYIMGKGSLT